MSKKRQERSEESHNTTSPTQALQYAEDAPGGWEMWEAVRALDSNPECGPASRNAANWSGTYINELGRELYRTIARKVEKCGSDQERLKALKAWVTTAGKVFGSSIAGFGWAEKADAQSTSRFGIVCADLGSIRKFARGQANELSDALRDKFPDLNLSEATIRTDFIEASLEGAEHPREDLVDILAKATPPEEAIEFVFEDLLPAVGDRPRKPDPKSVRNIEQFLRCTKIDIWHDDFSRTIRVSGVTGFEQGARISDQTLNRLWDNLHKRGCRVDKNFLKQSIDAIAARTVRHPVREYLNQTQPTWDGKPRVDELFIRYAGAVDTPLHRAIGRAFMIQAVRRVRRPGVELFGVPILEGFQGGEGKSKFTRILAGDEWHTDSLDFGASPKEVLEITEGKWIIEIPELSGLSGRREYEQVKAMITRTSDTARKAYGHYTTTDPRQFVMIGTTNDGAYLKDGAGSRRFWPVEVTGAQIDHDALAADRDQLWAEAAVLEASGESHNIPEELWGIAKEAQQLRVIGDPVEQWLEPLFEEMPDGFLPNSELQKAFAANQKDHDRALRSGVVAKVARKLGIEGGKAYGVRGYRKGGTDKIRLRYREASDADGLSSSTKHVTPEGFEEDSRRVTMLPISMKSKVQPISTAIN